MYILFFDKDVFNSSLIGYEVGSKKTEFSLSDAIFRFLGTKFVPIKPEVRILLLEEIIVILI